MKFFKFILAFSFLVFSFSGECLAFTRTGLIAEYNLSDQSASDSSGNGNHGIIHNVQFIGDRNNVANSAMFMNGQDAWIEIPTSALYNNLTSVTLSLWIRPKKGPNGENRAGSLLGKQPSGYCSQYHTPSTSNHGGLFDFDLCYDNNALKLYFCSQFTSGCGSEGHIANMPSLEYDQWQHIAITANQAQNRVKFYVNGVLVDDIVYSVYINDGRILSQVNTEPLRIGKRKDADFNQNLYFIGDMDDVKIYNRELSLSEVEELADFHRYSITLDPNDGSNATNIVFATYNAPMPQAPLPIRNGWAFTGYYDQPDGGLQYYTASMASARTWLSTNNITLYAQWLSCGIVRFKNPVVSISENGGVLSIPVERVNGSYGSASVTVIIEEGSATSDIDYEANPTTLTWATGSTATKNVYVSISADDLAEGNETFTAHFTNVTGASVNSNDFASVTILDDDSVPPTIRMETGLESNLLAFGDVATNSFLAKTVQIWNDGSLPLSITNITVSEGFSVTQQVFTVSAGEMVPLTVFFEPMLLGDYTGTIELMCVSVLGTAIIGATGRGIDPFSSFAHRTISGKTAIITVHVPTEATVLAIEGQLSSDMVAFAISDGGNWDPYTHKVKWVFDKQNDVRDRALQYSVGSTGQVITGSVSFGDRGSQIITGDTVFSSDDDPGRLHPADVDGNWRVDQNECTTSIGRWKKGQEDLKTAIAIRGITLYRQGESYFYDSTVSAEAKRWIPAGETSPSKLSAPLFAETPSLPQECVVRTVESNKVTIAITPPTGTLAYGMEESVAAGVTVANVSHEGYWDSNTRKIKWGFFDGTARELTYSITGVEGTQVSLAGTASFDGSEDAATGQPFAAVPLTYQTWAVSKGLSGSGDFTTLNPRRGEPNGLLYAFGSNLATNEPTIEIKWIDGMPVIETPIQDPATTPFVHVEILGSYDLRNLSWPINLQPLENSEGTPSNRRRWKAPDNTLTNQLFFKVRINNK